MKDEYIQNIVALYLAFHKSIPGAGRAHFTDLNRLLSPVIGTEKLENAVASFFSDQNRKVLRSGSPLSVASSVRLVGSSRLLAKVLGRNEKVLCLGVLMKLLNDNNQKNNTELLSNVRVVADIFSVPAETLGAIQNLFFDDEPHAEHYGISLLLTSSRPDYSKVVDGLRFTWHEKIGMTAWFLNLQEQDLILVKIIESRANNEIFAFRKDDVMPLDNRLRNFLEHHKVNTQQLQEEVKRVMPFLQRLEIPETDMTPRVVMDAESMCIELTGHCLATATQQFFAPVFRWIQKLSYRPGGNLAVHIRLDYFNTYSSKVLLDVFFKIKALEQNGIKADFYWYYQQYDEEMCETGEYYEEILKMKFHFVETENSELNLAGYE